MTNVRPDVQWTTTRLDDARVVDDVTVERPSLGLVLALAGAALVALGLFVLNWTTGQDFLDLRRGAAQYPAPFAVVTQLYLRVLYLPLFLVTVAVGVFGSVGRLASRAVAAVAGVLGGVGLLAAVVWVWSGHLGTGDSRSAALPALVLIALAGVAAAALGAAAAFDTRATVARGLSVVLAALAATLHVYVVTDLVRGPDPSFGAWTGAVGYLLLALAPVVPYRRILHTRR